MELTEILNALWRRKLATAAVIVLAAAATVGVKLSSHNVATGAATVQILVDSPTSALANLGQNTTPLTTRASVFAQVMASQAVLQDIAEAAGVPINQITAAGPYSGSGQVLDVVTPSEARGSQLLNEQRRYRLTFVAQQDEPVVTASVQGPSPATAGRLANSIFRGVQQYVTTLQQQTGTPAAQRVTIRQLGAPQTGAVNSGSRLTLAVVAGVGVLLLGLLGLLGLEGLRRRSRELATLERDFTPNFDHVVIDSGVGRSELDPRAPASVSAGVAGTERT
ncbi:MAG TPA: Wzz/FepE/Etk N-terminal domain-containing protein [Solirubrobacteraceae bacterium]|nr:Wzz/FepE/Etk N-terminal domain-containing protein [Solirubrobacteraceae bacterium]